MWSFRAGRDVGFRLGMPTRASATQAGGSLAGKVSIRLSRILSSSVLAIVSLSCKGRAVARPEKSGDAHGDIEQAFKYQQSPAVLLAADRPDSRDNGEHAIDQHIGREEDHQRQYRGARENQRGASEDKAENAPQREKPPV